MDIPRLQLLREAGERKNACDASRELDERGSHGSKGELKGQKKRNDWGLGWDDWKAGAVTCGGEVLSEN